MASPCFTTFAWPAPGNVVNQRDALKRFHIHVMRMRLEGIREKNDKINSLFHNRRANLLIPTEGLAGECCDVEAQLGAEYGASRSCREQVVVDETAAVAANPIEEIVLAVVVRDQSNALPGIHQQ